MNDTELQVNYYLACYHYAKNNGTSPSSGFVKLTHDGTEISIASWDHDSDQPSNEDLKAADLATVQATWNAHANDEEYAAIGGFLKYCLKDLMKDIEVLKGNPEPDDEAQEAMVRAAFDAYKAA